MSGRVPHRIHLSNPGNCQPSSRLSLLRSSFDRRRDRGRLGAIAVIGGWSGEATEGSRMEKRRLESCVQENKNEDVCIYRPDSLPISPLTQRLEKCHARHMVFAPPTQSTPTLTRGQGPTGQPSWVSQSVPRGDEVLHRCYV
jgi:hypothetical protein